MPSIYNLLHLLLFFCTTMTLSAQQFSIIIPNQYDEKLAGTENTIKENFIPYNYTSPTVNLKPYNARNPGLDLPESLDLLVPSFENYVDSVMLIGYLKESPSDEGVLIILLAGNYVTNEITFFVDRNLDLNYLNDGPPLILQAGKTTHKIQFKPDDGPARQINLTLPSREEFILERLNPRKVRVRGLAMGVHVGFGLGRLEYQYDNTELGFPTWYNVNISEKNIGLSFSYNLPLLIFRANATYQNLFFYTSYLNVRVDNPRLEIDPNTGQRRFIDNVLVSRNMDIHSKKRFQLGGSLAFRFHIGQFFELQPTFAVGRIFYTPAEYISDRWDDQVIHPLTSSDYWEAGLNMEFAVGRYKGFFLSVSANKTYWQPDDFFEALPQENLEIDNFTWRGLLGYRMSILR